LKLISRETPSWSNLGGHTRSPLRGSRNPSVQYNPNDSWGTYKDDQPCLRSNVSLILLGVVGIVAVFIRFHVDSFWQSGFLFRPRDFRLFRLGDCHDIWLEHGAAGETGSSIYLVAGVELLPLPFKYIDTCTEDK
jgi:hypothetical protein